MTTTSPPTTTTTLSTCQLGNGIKHVIHITFDNVHFTRDNPNVLSDLEQIPALVDFIESNGTMLSNHHTPLIAHTGDDLLTQYSGVYGDRHGMGISNSYEYYNGTAVTSADSFVYWTSPIIDHATQQPSSTDLNPSMVYSAQVPPVAIPSATTGHDAMTPAPWAPFTKAGCDVATVSTANMVLEKFADIPTVFGAGSPEAQQLAADTDGFKDAEVDDYIGVSLHCGQVGGVNSPLCANAQAVKFNQTTPSPAPPSICCRTSPAATITSWRCTASATWRPSSAAARTCRTTASRSPSRGEPGRSERADHRRWLPGPASGADRLAALQPRLPWLQPDRGGEPGIRRRHARGRRAGRLRVHLGRA